MSCSFPSSRGSSMCPRYTVGRKMRDSNLEQRINMKFCVNIGKSASKMLSLLTLGLWWILHEAIECYWMAQAVQGRARCVRGPEKWAAKNVMDRCKCGQSTNIGEPRSKIMSGYRNLFWGKDLNSGLASGFSTMTMPQHMMHYESASTCIRNPLKRNGPSTLFTWLSPLRFFGSFQN
jgi:hypothetical protein